MTIRFYSDEDRERMRREREREVLFAEWWRKYGRHRMRVASREPETPWLERMGLLQIRPWDAKG